LITFLAKAEQKKTAQRKNIIEPFYILYG